MFNGNAQFMFLVEMGGQPFFVRPNHLQNSLHAKIVEVLIKGEPARINLGKCLDMGKEEDDIKEIVCLLVYHFRLFVFVAISMCR